MAHTRSQPENAREIPGAAECQIIPHLGGTEPAKAPARTFAAMAQGADRERAGGSHCDQRAQALGTASWPMPPKTAPSPVTSLRFAGLPRSRSARSRSLRRSRSRTCCAKLEGHTLFPIVSLALATGMRRGELLGLQWGDIDLDRGVLRVERSLEETKAGLRFKPPKTKRGRRNITLPPDAVAMLRAHKVKQLELRLVLGLGKIEPSTLVLSDVEGEPLKPHTVSRAWQRVVVAKGLPRVSFHALRHTHASMLIRAGVDILTISRRLGHSAAAITLDVYGHLIEGADAAAAKAIEGVLK